MAQQMPSAMAPLIPGATPSGAAPAQPGAPDADSGPDSEQPGQTVVTITDNGDGSFSVSCDDGDDDSDPSDQDAQPQTATSVQAALKLAGQMLTGGSANAWNAEAAKRPAPPTGM